MEEKYVLFLYKRLQESGIEIWIDGGWGVDALLGKQTRPHDDLDIAVERKSVSKLRSLLKEFEEKKVKDSSDWNFILKDDKGLEIDIHVFAFDDKGNNTYGVEYPQESLTGRGSILGQNVNCIAPEYVIKFHGNYEPKEKDLQDIEALCDKFNLEPPKNYKKYLGFN